jgi:hypothetical protein
MRRLGQAQARDEAGAQPGRAWDKASVRRGERTPGTARGQR